MSLKLVMAAILRYLPNSVTLGTITLKRLKLDPHFLPQKCSPKIYFSQYTIYGDILSNY